MKNYDLFCKHYDDVMGNPTAVINLLKDLIQKHNPNANQILELACGTGTMLKPLEKKYHVFGLDLSKGMLSVAKKKIRKGIFYHQDMTSFNINQKFDVVFCVFDSINHLLIFSDWKKTFRRAKHHLNSNGIFIFDINTENKLKYLAQCPPQVQKFNQDYLIMNIEDMGRSIVNWNVKIFEHQKQNRYSLYEENIKETSFEYKKVKNALSSQFSVVKIQEGTGHYPRKKSQRLYFICKI